MRRCQSSGCAASRPSRSSLDRPLCCRMCSEGDLKSCSHSHCFAHTSYKAWWHLSCSHCPLTCHQGHRPLHACMLSARDWECRTSFSHAPAASRRSTGHQQYRPMADSGGPATLATLISGVPSDFGQGALGEPLRRRTRSNAHEAKGAEVRLSAGTLCRRQSVSAELFTSLACMQIARFVLR